MREGVIINRSDHILKNGNVGGGINMNMLVQFITCENYTVQV